jgi:hypothetical protein
MPALHFGGTGILPVLFHRLEACATISLIFISCRGGFETRPYSAARHYSAGNARPTFGGTGILAGAFAQAGSLCH